MEPLMGNPWTAGEVQEGSFLDQIFTFLLSLPPLIMLETKARAKHVASIYTPFPSFYLAEKTTFSLQIVNWIQEGHKAPSQRDQDGEDGKWPTDRQQGHKASGLEAPRQALGLLLSRAAWLSVLPLL